MRPLLPLLRWELIASARGTATHVGATFVALATAGLVGAGIVALNLWSPFSQITPTFPGRSDPASTGGLTPIIGEFRGGVAFAFALVWLLLIAGVTGPSLAAGSIVRERASGRIDRMLTDAGRADVVALTKLLGALVPLGLILLTIAPSTSFAWLLGGLPLAQVGASLAVIVAAVLLFAAIGLFSAVISTTEVAALLASALAIGIVLFGPLVAAEGLNVTNHRPAADVVVSADPFVALLSAQPQLAERLIRLAPTDLPTPQPALILGWTSVPYWAVDTVLLVVAAGVLVWLASIAIEPLHPLKTWRLRHSQLQRQPT
jgi:ABC-type transport system involved in multi-copper enzyme maturation permease subunit